MGLSAVFIYFSLYCGFTLLKESLFEGILPLSA
jgi:hypothetical protein